ncbi:17578_t:CDS:2, partial [Racocetra persica]
EFEIGDKVWTQRKDIEASQSAKFEEKRIGPFIIQAKLNNGAYKDLVVISFEVSEVSDFGFWQTGLRNFRLAESLAPEFVEKLEKYLQKFFIKSFDYSQFGNPKRIGQGGFAVVYSATFDGQIYALKSFNMNLKFEEKEFRQFRREIKCLYTI